MFAIFCSALSFVHFSPHTMSNNPRFRSSRSCALAVVHAPVEIVCFVICTENCTATVTALRAQMVSQGKNCNMEIVGTSYAIDSTN